MNWEDHRDELYTRVVRRGRALKWRRRGLATATIALVLAVSAGAYAATRPDVLPRKPLPKASPARSPEGGPPARSC